MSLAEELRVVIKGQVDDSKEILEKYSTDASLFKVMPQVVVRPENTEDIQRLVRFVAKEKETGRNISVTARSAGTDMSGGPLTESIVVDMLPHFNKIIEIGDDYAVVEPGVFFRDFDKETQKKNLELPSYTASREINTVGGMANNNSGGEKNLRYGKTERYVEELEMVLADGEVYTLKNLSENALKEKLQEKSFEGDVYRNVAALIKNNQETIQSSKPTVEKNSSGYALWDIGDGETSLNLMRLMVGAQGTMGIVTKIRFKLVPTQQYAAMAILFVDDIDCLGSLVPQVLNHKPDSFESYDDKTFSLATKYFPEFALQMKSNFFELGLTFLPEVWRVLVSGVPKLVLLVEFKSNDQAEALSKAQALIKDVKNHEKCTHTFLAKNEKETRKYWVIRRESFNLLRKKIRGKRTAPFIDDFVVSPHKLSDFLPRLNAILNEYDLIYTIAGHVGDGNFHIIPLMDPMRPDGRRIVEDLSEKVYDLVLEFGGSITGEHNDGLARTQYVERMFGKDMTSLFEQIQSILDPLDIFNPGKKVARNGKDPFDYLDLGTS